MNRKRWIPRTQLRYCTSMASKYNYIAHSLESSYIELPDPLLLYSPPIPMVSNRGAQLRIPSLVETHPPHGESFEKTVI